jgi:hypothetical protein
MLLTVCGLALLAAGTIPTTGAAMAQESRVFGTGTVRFNPLEGGFFQIEADDRTTYTPMELPAPYRRDGLRVRFVGRLRPDVMSIYMSGQMLELIQIERE